ncbi:MAG: hypothetical protein ACI4GY_08355 [Acutalibacteraceae bacterium]
MSKNKIPQEKKEPSMAKPFDEDIKKAFCIFLVLLVIFCLGNFTGSLLNTKKNVSVEPETSAATTTAATTAQTTAATTAAPVSSEPASSAAQTDAVSQDNPSASSEPAPAADANASAAASTGAPTAKADIIKLFNESANKIKTNASKVTRNYEDLQHNEDLTEMPSVAESVGKPLISKFLKKDETPVEYSGADITTNYPVKGESFVSNATEADVMDATCTDDGTNYNITLKFNECTDPQGSGCANAFNVMKTEDIVSASGGIVSQSSTRYYDAVIECKIDKATGNMIWANYKLPMVLSVTAKIVFASVDAKIGMTFIDDYTITY